MSKEEATQEFMIRFLEARVNIEVDRNKYLSNELAKEKAFSKVIDDELKREKSFNKGLRDDNDRLHDLLDNSEDNVKRVTLLMAELKLNGSID